MLLSATQVLAASTEALTASGYRQAPAPSDWPTASRLFEDEYGIVAVHVYDTWTRLFAHWNTAQGLLVDLLSERLARPEPKAWEGYLVLLTPNTVMDAERRDVVDLRYNTSRLRKLVATGQELQTVEDVRRALLPLLRLDYQPQQRMSGGILARLPELLAADGIDPGVTTAAVAAFLENESIMDRLHHMELQS